MSVRTRVTSLVICLSVTLIACAEQRVPLSDDNSKTLYFLGTALSRNIMALELTDKEMDFVIQGLRDAMSGDAIELDEAKYGEQLNALAQQRISSRAEEEGALAETYIQQMAAEEGAMTTDSGIVIRALVVGDGPQPTGDSVVKAHYHGTLRDGSVFDSSVERGQPFETGLDRVIPCWTEAIQTMKVGGKSKITCPSQLAYGPAGSGSIPGGAALTFEVELLDIVE